MILSIVVSTVVSALFGALAGALLEATYFFTFWINLRVPLGPMVTRALAGWARMVIAGGIIGLLAH